jgi:hypothetical protein
MLRCFSLSFLVFPVRPDPPVAVNWTLLGVSPYGLHYDVIVTWDPPASADVSMGWMSLAYEVQYRRWNSSEWTVVSSPASVAGPLLSLRTLRFLLFVFSSCVLSFLSPFFLVYVNVTVNYVNPLKPVTGTDSTVHMPIVNRSSCN